MVTIIGSRDIRTMSIERAASLAQMRYAMVRKRCHNAAARIETSRDGDRGSGYVTVLGDWRALMAARNAYWRRFRTRQAPIGY